MWWDGDVHRCRWLVLWEPPHGFSPCPAKGPLRSPHFRKHLKQFSTKPCPLRAQHVNSLCSFCRNWGLGMGRGLENGFLTCSFKSLDINMFYWGIIKIQEVAQAVSLHSVQRFWTNVCSCVNTQNKIRSVSFTPESSCTLWLVPPPHSLPTHRPPLSSFLST